MDRDLSLERVSKFVQRTKTDIRCVIVSKGQSCFSGFVPLSVL